MNIDLTNAVDVPNMEWYSFPNFSCSVPVMQIGFVTNQVTVYYVMKNFASLVDQLEQEFLYVFCGEGYIYLKRPEEFQKRIPMMGSFHVTK